MAEVRLNQEFPLFNMESGGILYEEGEFTSIKASMNQLTLRLDRFPAFRIMVFAGCVATKEPPIMNQGRVILVRTLPEDRVITSALRYESEKRLLRFKVLFDEGVEAISAMNGRMFDKTQEVAFSHFISPDEKIPIVQDINQPVRGGTFPLLLPRQHTTNWHQYPPIEREDTYVLMTSNQESKIGDLKGMFFMDQEDHVEVPSIFNF